MLFKCRVCSEKDLRIADLKAQIATLKELVITSNDPDRTPARSLEADAILSGQQHLIEIDETEIPPTDESDSEIYERDRILSGTYS